ncbi:pilus assembly protein [Sinimarinibacterium sp. CAU 1509]|uniref:TadE/TadG family type IV pilus assembly protein n=1 Tax=Sinimarinibacterium sp. CAU 1509 TaxID=2562283 RepID=UPI0010AD6ED7|nr:TadE/TadG family type IV pilus assembly protein [Sinimarinibacterium sp. CAU 1509]TJY63187.1 pilus assembly protein [Sinimarinibacterium sp. CAU 1509]
MNPQIKLNRGRRQAGAAVIEFAFVLPIFVLILYGMVTFGSVLYTQMALSRAASDGARALGLASGSTTSYASITESVKDSIKLEVVNSLSSSIIAPAGIGDYAARRTWLEQTVLPTVVVDNGSCGGGEASAGLLRVRVSYPYSSARILPSITLPIVGGFDSWMPQTLSGCAIVQL